MVLICFSIVRCTHEKNAEQTSQTPLPRTMEDTVKPQQYREMDWVDSFTLSYINKHKPDITMEDTTVDLVFYRDTLPNKDVNVHITWWFEHHLVPGQFLLLRPKTREAFEYDVTNDSIIPYHY